MSSGVIEHNFVAEKEEKHRSVIAGMRSKADSEDWLSRSFRGNKGDPNVLGEKLSRRCQKNPCTVAMAAAAQCRGGDVTVLPGATMQPISCR